MDTTGHEQNPAVATGARNSRKRSDVWVNFTPFTTGDGKSKAECNMCKRVLAADSSTNGTSSLRSHVLRNCRPRRFDGRATDGHESNQTTLHFGYQMPQQQPSLSPLPPPLGEPSRPHGSSDRGASGLETADVGAPQPMSPMTRSLSEPGSSGHDQDEEEVQKLMCDFGQLLTKDKEQEEACKHLARMIALRGYDASVMEDDCFRSFVKSINPEFEVPPRVSIENMCDGIFDEARRDLLDRLRHAPGKVSVAVGRAKTMEEQVVYVACHFIDDRWNLRKLLLHASVTTDHRSCVEGPILGLDVRTGDFGVKYLGTRVISRHGIDNRLFLVACEMTDIDVHLVLRREYSLWPDLSLTNPNRKRKEIHFTNYVDNVLHSIARCLLPDRELTEAIVDDMENLLLTREERLKLLAELGLHYSWAYDEHWYACYCSLKVLCKKSFPGQLRNLEYIATAKLLCKVWEEIFCGIQKISSATCPTANLCLVELFKLREVLHPGLEWFKDVHEEDIEDVNYVLKNANDILDNAIKDSYLTWSLPLAMDPRYKLQFITSNLKEAYGEAAEEYVSKMTTMITELYDDYVEVYSTTDGAHHSDSASATQVSSCYHPEVETELDRYLNDPPHDPQAERFDILSWWKSHSSEYPMVARMARDALAMPTCSKLSSDQMAQLRSILRSYSKKPYKNLVEGDAEEE